MQTMDDRKKLIREIESKASCVLLCLATSERPNVNVALLDESYVVEAHRLLRAVSLAEGQCLGLLLYSRGGASSVPLELVAMIREMFPKQRLKVFVPYRAYSAATVIALGADEIVMGPRGHLGPIDATIAGYPHNPKDDMGNTLPVGVEEVRKYFELVSEMFDRPSNLPQLEVAAFQALAASVSPLALGAVQRTLKSTEHDARVLLKGRLEPKSDEENDKIVENLATEITFHGHAIFRTEAKNLGIDFVKHSEEYELEDELWRLVEAYMDLFDVEKPFEARLRVAIDGEGESKKDNLPLGLLETRTDGRLCLVDYVWRGVRPPVPTVQLAANLEDAQGVVTKLTEGIRNSLPKGKDDADVPSEEQIQEMVVGLFQQAIQEWLKVEGERAVKRALEATQPPPNVMEWARNRRWEALDM